jgi:uncharacterized MAPEG superfamily protein
MASFLDFTRNFSYYTIPAAWVLSIAPHVYATSLHDSKSPETKFDNCSPRTLVPSLDRNQSLDSETKQTIIRAEAAQQNGFENIGLFAAAVVAANAAKVDSWWLNTLSFGYLGSRVVYNVLYIGGANGARTAVFLGGVGMIFTLFIQAGNKVRNAVL